MSGLAQHSNNARPSLSPRRSSQPAPLALAMAELLSVPEDFPPPPPDDVGLPPVVVSLSVADDFVRHNRFSSIALGQRAVVRLSGHARFASRTSTVGSLEENQNQQNNNIIPTPPPEEVEEISRRHSRVRSSSSSFSNALDPTELAKLDGLSRSPRARVSSLGNSLANLVEKFSEGPDDQSGLSLGTAVKLGLAHLRARGETRARPETITSNKRENRHVQFSDSLVDPPISSSSSSSSPALAHPRPALRSPLNEISQLSMKESHEAMARRFRYEAHYRAFLRRGALLTKYNSRGFPERKFFYLTLDDDFLQWEAPDARGNSPKPPAMRAMPEIRMFGIVMNRQRSFETADFLSVHYGALTQKFSRYRARQDGASGKSWLGMSIFCNQRTIDIICSNEAEVTAWFLGLQSLCTQNAAFLTRGALLWQRLIMKLNHYGLEPIMKE